MFVMPVWLALIGAALQFLAGAAVGVTVTAIVLRFRLRLKLAVGAAFVCGVVWVAVSVLAGWAGMHAVISDGHRLDIAPWGEDLRTRNWVAEHEAAIETCSSAIAALQYALVLKVFGTKQAT